LITLCDHVPVAEGPFRDRNSPLAPGPSVLVVDHWCRSLMEWEAKIRIAIADDLD